MEQTYQFKDKILFTAVYYKSIIIYQKKRKEVKILNLYFCLIYNKYLHYIFNDPLFI